MKKFKIGLFLLVILIVISGSITVFGSELDNFETARFTYIQVFVNEFTISSIGKAEVSSSVYATGAQEVSVVSYLQKYDGNSFNTLAQWSNRESGRVTGIEGVRYLMSGYYYRFVSYAYVYIDDEIVETTVYVSNSKYY